MMKMSNEHLYVWGRYLSKRSGLEIKFESNHGGNFFIVAVDTFGRLYRVRTK